MKPKVQRSLVTAAGALWLAIVMCGSLALAPAPAGAADSPELTQLKAAISDLEDVITNLALKKQLSAEELNNLRGELAIIYQDLEFLRDQLAGAKPDAPPVDAGQWLPYREAEVEITPPDAQYDGWTAATKVNLAWGEYGQILLTVDTGQYVARWEINDAYRGNVDAKLETARDGTITVKVTDNDGAHEFMLPEGGLGDCYVRGRTGYTPPAKQVSPVENEPVKTTQPTASGGKWYAAYQAQVDAGQIEDSAAMRWLIDQYNRGQYSNPALKSLGDALNRLPVAPDDQPIGSLKYTVAGEAKVISIPDPRYSPSIFAYAITKIKALLDAGNTFELGLYI